MTQKQALQTIKTAIYGRRDDIELRQDQILGKTYALTINGHEKGWIKSDFYKPTELLAWLKGVNTLYFTGHILYTF